MLTDFQNLCTVGKHVKFPTKPIWHYPPHLRDVATLPWEIKKCNFSACIQHTWKKMETNCIFIPSNFVIRPEILLFLVFKMASFSPYWLQIKFSMLVFFYLFTFAINLWYRKFVTAVFVNNQPGIQRQEQDFDKTT